MTPCRATATSMISTSAPTARGLSTRPTVRGTINIRSTPSCCPMVIRSRSIRLPGRTCGWVTPSSVRIAASCSTQSIPARARAAHFTASHLTAVKTRRLSSPPRLPTGLLITGSPPAATGSSIRPTRSRRASTTFTVLHPTAVGRPSSSTVRWSPVVGSIV